MKDKKIRLLFVNVEEVNHWVDLGMPPYSDWIADVTGLPKEQIITVNAADGDSFPKNFAGIDGIVGGGSGHQPYEDEPWIKKTGKFLMKAHFAGVPQLLNCFCHQVFAAALGGKTELGDKERRFGIETLHLTEAGLQDPLFRGLPPTFNLFTSHSAVVTQLPPSTKIDVTELAKTDHYHYESLSYEGNTRTLQTHPDLKEKLMQALARKRTHPFSNSKNIGLESYNRYLASPPDSEKIAEIEDNGRKIFQNWLTYFVIPNKD